MYFLLLVFPVTADVCWGHSLQAIILKPLTFSVCLQYYSVFTHQLNVALHFSSIVRTRYTRFHFFRIGYVTFMFLFIRDVHFILSFSASVFSCPIWMFTTLVDSIFIPSDVSCFLCGRGGPFFTCTYPLRADLVNGWLLDYGSDRKLLLSFIRYYDCPRLTGLRDIIENQ